MLAAIGVALPMLLAQCGTAAAQECVGGREAQQAVEAQRILPLDRALQAAGVPVDRVISRGAEVCDIDGNPYYRVNVQDEYGNSETVALPARGN